MSLALTLHATEAEADLLALRSELASARTALQQRTADLERLRAGLKLFEDRYFREVGVLYAELDAIEARIAEREIDLYQSDAARVRAAEARQKADESDEAVSNHVAEAAPFDPPASLRTLFREVAKRIHPDLARDEEEARYFTLLMARANQAYRRGDTDMLQRLRADERELAATGHHTDRTAEMNRVMRQVLHVRRELAALDAEWQSLHSSDIAQLHSESEGAAREHRDLLGELANGLREQVADAARRYDFVDKQIAAHGR